MIEENQMKEIKPLMLLREQLLPNLLGEEMDDILYWAGKELARTSIVDDEQSLIQLFEDNGFGHLSLANEKKNKKEYVLSGLIVTARLTDRNVASFSLEAGFLAQQHQEIHQIFTEAIYEVNEKKDQAVIYVQTDPNEPLTHH
ncbi:DUF2507 domain-containing protein [Marinilactibacillus kalidii]|uniref:DUF2507 domain-containing protein n=1 Tax=Marinilactibacillus kalidii TaxID=2820274 RepID=UPI001ABDD40C|nr:DUF2507 domain-containing protein [Marinilactibacillus kalidii]